MKGLNYENILYDTLSQEANLFVNKKLLAQLESDLALFISFLIDKGRYHKFNNGLTEEGYFYATNEDIYLFTRIPRKRIVKLKKQGAEQELFFIKKSSNSFNGATYYRLNFEKILEIISSDKTAMELAYETSIPTNEEVGYSEETIMKLSYRDLKLVCKKLKIPYRGTDRKTTLIEKILENQGLNKLTPKVPTSGQEKCQLVDTKSANRLTPKVPQKKSKEKNQIEKNQIEKNQIIDDVDFFESLFKEINITYTKTNKASVEKLLKNMTKKEVELYLKETYEAIKETPGVKSIARLFSSKIAKGERQIISPKQKKENISTLPLTQNIVTLDDSNNNKENTIFSSMNNNTITDNTLDKFYRLSEYEQLKIEEEALKMCITKENVEENFLLNMKEISKTIYHSTLKKYIKVILEDKKLLEALENSN
ncbi:hypothetical protein [Fusobacterium sp. FSA-380-WT-2B]|uniref:hypothetical protein n=1 Tax=Fusobacterium sp. FSA-380-WT-2B TaxID=2605786 RepID=UPI0012B339A9|nr:hypothetical protein [Fusobacterium sp. FSA-380-WT-2B]MSS61478.1 hypothetical protein [Fusobacterium sp. FSA-380-WT-2B]